MNRVLVVVDYQKDFIDGALGFSGAENIEDKIIELIKEFKSQGDMVLFLKDTHQDNYMETIEGKYLPVPHCIKGTEGWNYPPHLEAEVGYLPPIEKETFGSLTLGNILKGLNPYEIHLCGLVSDICVFTNAVIAKSACPNAEIFIRADASDSSDKEMEEKTYDVAKHLHIQIIE